MTPITTKYAIARALRCGLVLPVGGVAPPSVLVRGTAPESPPSGGLAPASSESAAAAAGGHLATASDSDSECHSERLAPAARLLRPAAACEAGARPDQRHGGTADPCGGHCQPQGHWQPASERRGATQQGARDSDHSHRQVGLPTRLSTHKPAGVGVQRSRYCY
jgi:hypothetical protein